VVAIRKSRLRKNILSESTLIRAPLEPVFAYYAEPENAHELWPSVVSVSDVLRDTDGRPRRWHWTRGCAGAHVLGVADVTVYLRNRRTVVLLRGAVAGVMSVTYTHTRRGTRVTTTLETTDLGALELRAAHATLKARLEGY
jgi:hypothetical protein